MNELKKLVNTVEFTDELIHLNKHYSKLNNLYDKLTEIEEIINDLDTPDITCANNEIKMYAKKGKRIDINEAAKVIAQLLHRVSFEATHTSYKSQELLTFQKLGNAIFLYKGIKNEENPY